VKIPIKVAKIDSSCTINLMEELTKEFTKTEQESFWSGTAKQSYRLKV
jgi:hypothetical protein